MSYGLLAEGAAHPSPDSVSPRTRPRTRPSDDVPSIYLMCDFPYARANDVSDHSHYCSRAVQEVNNIGLVDFLENDPRPTFVLDLNVPDEPRNLLRPLYLNTALAESDDGSLLSLISGKDNMDTPGAYATRTYSKFRKWIYAKEKDTQHAGLSYGNTQWTKVTMKGRWNVVSGAPEHPPSESGFGDLSPAPSRTGTSGIRTPTLVGNFGVSQERRPSYGGHSRAQSDDMVIMQPRTRRAEIPEESLSRLARVDGANSSEYDVACVGSFDWTSDSPLPNMSDHIRFARSVDWSQTPLGPMSSWSAPLRMMSNLIMRDPNPGVLFWGEDVIMVYNEAYIELLGQMHPMAMGKSASVALKDYWDHFVPFIVRNKVSGEAVPEKDLPIFLPRNTCLEETYFSFTFLPIMDERGNHVGHYEPVTETTRQVVSERRLSTLLRLSEETSTARSLNAFWRSVLQALSANDKDVPFALLYAVEDDEDSSDNLSASASSTSNVVKQCILKGSLGVPEGHPAAPSRLDYLQSIEGFMPYFREAVKSRKPTVLHLDNGNSPMGLLDGIQWRGFGDPCKSLVICPITPTTSTNVLGFLITGLNPRRPYDEDYQQFMGVTSRLLATSLASVVLHEEEIRQRENMITQAELIKTRLVEQLDVSRKEVERNEKKFQRFAERADVAIFIVGSDGRYTYRNHAWYEIFQLDDPDLDIRDAWPQLCNDEDLAKCEHYFMRLMVEKTPVVFELRLKRSWSPANDDPARQIADGQVEHSVWILCSAYPELSESGEVREIVGCVTDISRQKWGEGLQKQRTEDALESKRQLENFIDTTSHEMRNPLSAIIQCADGIINSHSSHLSTTEDISTAYRRLLESATDAAQTIVQCSQHMKCIVDDVLTMSKLDSGLLVITPVDTQPEGIGRHAVKMFEAEAKAAGVDLSFAVDQSYREAGLDWVSLDPTRLLQVLINLVTNAIKFTRLESRRSVTVSVGASISRPTHCNMGKVEYIRTATAAEAPSLVTDWAKGDCIYLQFSVQDTGRGLTNDEKDLLFARFSQASPRTHIRYGGSGLGLFISRRLTEMQGGAIGFASQFRSGSKFSFYIKTRRSQAPSVEMRTIDQLDEMLTPLTPILQHSSSASPNPTPPQSPTRTRSGSDDSLLNPAKRPSLQRLESSTLTPRSDPIHVLLVEDNLINQRVLANQLRSKGCLVSVANHGAEALDFLRGTIYAREPLDGKVPILLDVILMDWEMPVMDGLTAVREIRRMQREPDGVLRGHIPVIAVTANVRNEQISKAMEAGMDDVVSKPFRVPELCTRMRELISRFDGVR
ncbi:aerobic respiration control sensor protein-like protein arcB [Macrophomina phaseolina]|uniref:Aerobic respiration control sensor protein-like protein arcB n=1 Tax=Macrophomina phaseolina TaxID=35725 RepID=A0ABQ8GC83_9PEZI|nr:aerobic respiration control sensor protein-like protein arcB [Macrophomina phaseolina]